MSIHPLRKYRTENGITLEHLAQMVGVTRATLSRIETWLQSPSLSLVCRLINATGGALSADDFIEKQARGGVK